MRRLAPRLALRLASALALGAGVAAPALAVPAEERAARPVSLRVQPGECRAQLGPFATHATGWRRRHQAMAEGHAVSGLYLCHANGRGYCFEVFYPC